MVVEPFVYAVGELGGNDSITVPAGFITDFASVPRLFWRLFPPWGKYGKAAVLHDYLYHKQRRSRREADAIFLEAMGVLGVPWLSREMMYAAVRAFGWAAWRSNRRKKEQV